MKKIAIAGISGYSGQVLKTLIEGHPHFELSAAIGREHNLTDLKKQCEIAFLCTPAETSLDLAPKLLEQGISVIDLSGAFRLKKHSYSEWYLLEHDAPNELGLAIYGLLPFAESEIRKVSTQKKPALIANPGCYATACLLGLIPLLKSGLIDPQSLALDAKSGTTGAGKKANTDLLFSEIFGNFYPYRLGKHQHWPEIVEATSTYGTQHIAPSLVTELLPIDRGISVCIFSRWKKAGPEQIEQLLKTYQENYAQSPEIFVGQDPQLLALKKIVGQAGAQIHVSEAYGQPLVFVCIDNLMRGAASQALMNANILCGRPALEGL